MSSVHPFSLYLWKPEILKDIRKLMNQVEHSYILTLRICEA